MEALGRVVTRLLDVLSPPCCAACDAPCSTLFCDACGAPTPAEPGAVAGVPLITAGVYAPPLSTAIARFKYQGRAELSRGLARLLLPELAALALSTDIKLVPVPLHPRRLATRGYNQATLVAQQLGRQLGLGCEPRLLRRARETERQVGKSRALRLANAAGAFELRAVEASRVILVDDVVTTGSTVRACAQALNASGVELLAVVALARALPG